MADVAQGHPPVTEYMDPQPVATYDDLVAQKVDRTIAQHQIRNLLAVIHGDGGHYADEHGLEKATEDAQAKWYARGTQLDRCRKALEEIIASAHPSDHATKLGACVTLALIARAALDPEAA